MCDICEATRLSRRSMFGALAMGAAAASSAIGMPAFAADGQKTNLTPDQALAALKAGNERYVTNPQVCSMDLATKRNQTAAGQAPWAIILGCADSRVPPELLFGGLSVGELFVARNAGNVVNVDNVGTLEYGTAVLGAPLIVVLGHEKCGAVAAACDVVTKNATYPGSIGPMIESIVPAAVAQNGKPGDFIDNTVRESARRGASRILAMSSIISGLVGQGKVKIVSARYGLADGKVDFLT